MRTADLAGRYVESVCVLYLLVVIGELTPQGYALGRLRRAEQVFGVRTDHCYRRNEPDSQGMDDEIG